MAGRDYAHTVRRMITRRRAWDRVRVCVTTDETLGFFGRLYG